MQVKEKYRGLSRQELQEKAYELGANYERNSYSCSQSTVAALHEILGFEDAIVKVATSSCAGQVLQATGTCGALVGGTMVLDYYFGRPIQNLSDKEIVQANIDAASNSFEVAKLLYDKYIEEYGTIICAHIQAQLFGRVYYLYDPQEVEKFEEAGGHTDPQKCLNIIGNAARWVIEILLDKNAIKL
jgi:C_GCAxxG_C_C family probable redox protein